jgi:hypothetical protein
VARPLADHEPETIWLAHKQAVRDGGELRLAIPADGAVARIFQLTGADQLIPCFPSLTQAIGAGRPS